MMIRMVKNNYFWARLKLEVLRYNMLLCSRQILLQINWEALLAFQSRFKQCLFNVHFHLEIIPYRRRRILKKEYKQ